MRMKDSERKIEATYVFGEREYKCHRKFLIPIVIGNHKALLETEIVEGNIPWLVGTVVLDKLGARIDFANKY